ncbi:MAG: hypothetical protein AB7V46_16520 [Thermomicrobiales bacterium]
MAALLMPPSQAVLTSNGLKVGDRPVSRIAPHRREELGRRVRVE